MITLDVPKIVCDLAEHFDLLIINTDVNEFKDSYYINDVKNPLVFKPFNNDGIGSGSDIIVLKTYDEYRIFVSELLTNEIDDVDELYPSDQPILI